MQSFYAAIVVVGEDWRPGMPVGFSQDAYYQWQETFSCFQPVLIYQSKPVNAIIAEGELERLSGWSAVNDHQPLLTSQGMNADYLLPLRVSYTRPMYSYIPLHHVRKWAQSAIFPQTEWIPINQAAYDEFSDWS